MKRIYFLLGMVLLGGTTYAQVGIGTPIPDPSTQLDVVASDKGIMIPRVALTSTTDVTTIANMASGSDKTSLLVFNTATAADVTPGYYYWDGTKWLRLLTSDNNTETLTTLIDNGNGTYTYTSEDGTITIINVVADIYNYGDTLLSNSTFVNNLSDTLITNQQFLNNLTNIIQSSETLTTLVDNGDGTMTYTDENGVAIVIDITNMETLTSLVDNGDGTMTYTDEDGVATIINIANMETLTSLVDNGDGTMTYTDEDGVATVINIANMETLTSLVDNGDGTMTYTDEDGVATIINIANMETLTSLVDNGDGTMTYTDEDGVATVINIANMETLTSLVDNGDGTMTYTDEDGVATVINIANMETLTSLVDNGDGTMTYTDEDGVATIINVANLETTTTLVDNGDGTMTYTDEDGVTTIIDIANMETLTSLVDNGDGTMTYTDEDGVATIINIANMETLTSLVDNGDGTMTYTDEDGITTVINIANMETLTSLVDNGDGTMTYTDEDGIATVISIANMETLTSLVDNGDGTMTYTDEDGVATIINVANLETLTSLVDNGDGTMTYIDEDGVATIINIANMETLTSLVDNGDGTMTYTDEDGVATIINIANMETLTSLVDNGNGTFTYISENGTVTIFEAKGTLVDNLNGTYTFTDAGGTVTTISTTSLEPWFGTDNNAAATLNSEDIYTMGRVAIGQTTIPTNTGAVINSGINQTSLQLVSTGGLAGLKILATASVSDWGIYNQAADNSLQFRNAGSIWMTLKPNGEVGLGTGSAALTDKLDVAGTVRVRTLPAAGATDVVVVADATTGQLHQKSAASLVSGNETLTTLVDNGDGTFTYTSENGTVTTFDAKGTLVNNLNGTYTFTDAAGTATVINTNGMSVSNVIAGHLIATVTEADGTTVDIDETITSVADNNASASVKTIATYTNENGTPQVIEETVTALSILGSTLTYRDENGAFTNIVVPETTTGITNTMVGHQIGIYHDEVGGATPINETVTNLTQSNVTGIISYTNENGTTQTADVISAAPGNIIIAGADGGAYLNTAAIAANETNTTLSISAGQLVYNNEDANNANVNLISTDAGNSVVAGTDGALYVPVAGTSVVTQNAVNTDAEVLGGTAHTIATHNDGTGTVVTLNETVSTFVDNGDGTYTYTNENGISTVTAAAVNIYNADGTLAGPRVVTHNDNNLTFTTGANGRFVIDGTFEKSNGAVYYSYRVESGVTVGWLNTDYVVVLSNLGVDGNLTLPPAASFPGRVIKLANDTGAALFFNSTVPGTYPSNVPSIASRTGSEFMSTGTDWVRITGR